MQIFLCFDMVIIACVCLPALVSVGRKWRCSINARAAVATVLFLVCVWCSLGCSKCTKTSGCLWSSPASSCPKKTWNKRQQRRRKVTPPQPSFHRHWHAQHQLFLTWFISLSLLGVGCKIHRDRADARRSNDSTKQRVYCINTEGSQLLHIQPSAQTLHCASASAVSVHAVLVFRGAFLTALQMLWKN